MINRGGQKVSPVEVEQALLANPAVNEAVVVAFPDPQLGEEVGAAVVLHPDVVITESGLRAFVAKTLAPYKLPRRIAFLDELPKTALGKIQRSGLAQQLGWTLPAAAAPAGFEVPGTPIEKALARLWSEILNRPLDQISLNDRFTELGGTSLNATQLVLKTRATLNIPVTILDFFNASTIPLQAAVIEEIIQNPRSGRQNTDLIPIQPIGLRCWQVSALLW